MWLTAGGMSLPADKRTGRKRRPLDRRGEGRGSKSPKFSRRHYVAVAKTLKEGNASKAMVESFATMFDKDNERFSRDRFVKAAGY